MIEETATDAEDTLTVREYHPADFLGVLELTTAEDHLVRRYFNLLHNVESSIPYEGIDLERTVVLSHGQIGWFSWARFNFSMFIASALITMLFVPGSSLPLRAALCGPWFFLAAFCTVFAFVKKSFIAFFDGFGNLLFEIRNVTPNKAFYDHLRTKIEIADMTQPAMRIEEEEPLD